MGHLKNYPLKVVVIGDESVGKTSLIESYKNLRKYTFVPKVVPTDGVVFHTNTHRYTDAEIQLKMWDFSGKDTELMKRIRQAYYPNTNVIILVFDLTRIETLDRLQRILSEERKHMPDCPILVVGNKSDKHMKRDVTIEEALAVVAGIENARYMEANEKDSYKAKLVFDRAMRLGFQHKYPEDQRFCEEQEWSVAVDNHPHKPNSNELVETHYSDEVNTSIDEQRISHPALIKLRNYAGVLTMLNQMGWKKNDLRKGLEKGDFLWNHVLRDGRAPSKAEIKEILTQNNEHVLDNRSKWPFKLYKIRSFFTGHRNPCQDNRLCESRTEELLVDYFKCL